MDVGEAALGIDELAEEAARGLIPPGERWSERKRYDWTVSIVLGAVTFMTILHIAWACGYMSMLGLHGFALANDVTQQQATLTNIQVGQITRDMRDEKRQVCMAQRAGNQSALYSWSLALEKSKGDYHAIIGQWPQVWSCEDLLVQTAASPSP